MPSFPPLHKGAEQSAVCIIEWVMNMYLGATPEASDLKNSCKVKEIKAGCRVVSNLTTTIEQKGNFSGLSKSNSLHHRHYVECSLNVLSHH